jgi:hypothetical protein
MMGSIPGDVRGGLMELFYGVYNRDPDRCALGVICFTACLCGGTGLARAAAVSCAQHGGASVPQQCTRQRTPLAGHARRTHTHTHARARAERWVNTKHTTTATQVPGCDGRDGRAEANG